MFVNRVEQQLYSIGGGGAGFIKDLDDVTFTGITTGSLLIYEADTQKWVGIASTAIGGAADELAAGCTGVDLTLSGDLNVSGDLVYDEVTGRNINISGVTTVNQLQSTNLHVSGISTFVGLATCGVLTAYNSISVGGTDILSELSGKTSIGLAIALG